jgi:hypothetical protein
MITAMLLAAYTLPIVLIFSLLALMAEYFEE